MRNGGFAGSIVSFEPSPASFEALTISTSADSNWSCRQIALGAKRSTKTLNINSGDGQFDSIRALSCCAQSYRPDLTTVASQLVDVQALDDLAEELHFDRRPTLLKIDTQGYDLEVLKGCQRSLPLIRSVLLEAPVQALYEGAPLIEEIIAVMRDAQFELSGAFPIHRYGPHGVRTIEFDCTFINRSFV